MAQLSPEDIEQARAAWDSMVACIQDYFAGGEEDQHLAELIYEYNHIWGELNDKARGPA